MKEQLSLINVVGILVSFVGLVSIICQGSLEILLNLALNWGDLLILIGQLSWATYTVYSRIALANRSPAAATASSYIAGSFILVPLCLIESPFSTDVDSVAAPLAVVGHCFEPHATPHRPAVPRYPCGSLSRVGHPPGQRVGLQGLP